MDIYIYTHIYTIYLPSPIYILRERDTHIVHLKYLKFSFVKIHTKFKRSNKQKQKKNLFEHQGEQILSH